VEKLFTRLIVLACVGTLALQVMYEPTTTALWLDGEGLRNGELYRMVTSGFLHAGNGHLLSNMVILYLLGRQLEPMLLRGGRWQYPVVYLGSLIGGSVGHLVVHGGDLPVLGASGAVFGVMGCAAVYGWRMGYGWSLISLFPNGGRLQLITTVAPWFFVMLALQILAPEEGISTGGHIGGAIAGFVLGYVMVANDPNRRTHPPDGWE
jgi:membrane associated rhomboid family serine protease